MTELRNPDRYSVICEESAPILKMTMTPDQSSIWVATSESTINNWVNYAQMIFFSEKSNHRGHWCDGIVVSVLVPGFRRRVGYRFRSFNENKN